MTDRAQLALIILDGSSQFTALLDNEGRVLDANRAALEHDGLGREEVIGRAFWETSRWRSAPEASAWLRAAVDGAAAGKPAHGALALPGSGEDGGG